MRKLLVISFALFLTCMSAGSVAASDSPRKFDEYGAIQCEDEMARLDNYVNEVRSWETQNWPDSQAVVIVYGGRRDTRRHEVNARLTRIKNYLLKQRGLQAGQLAVFDGGFRENFTVELWLIPQGADAKLLAAPTVETEKVRYKKGKVKKWEYDCSVLG